MSNKGRPPNNDERTLWDRFVSGISPLHKSTDHGSIQKPKKSAPIPPKSSSKPTINPQILRTKPVENMLDRKTMDRLKKGKMPVEATLDLHDKNQDQAYNALKGFITRAVQSQKRCVLVITGKGTRTQADGFWSSKREGEGVLKSRLPEWVAISPLNEMVLRAQPAHPKHGGAGAFYLYLKRRREP